MKYIDKVLIFYLSTLSVSVYSATTITAKNTYYGPASYASILAKSYSPKFSISSQGMTTNRGRYLLSTSPKVSTTANYLSIGTTYNAMTGYVAQSGTIPFTTTYGAYFSKLIQVVSNSSDNSGFYRLDSHLHSNYSLDADEADSYILKFRNNFGKTANTYGYVVFSYDSSTHLLRAEKRYIYHLSPKSTTDAHGKPVVTYSATYTEDMSFANKGSGYYVSYLKNTYKLVPQPSLATKLYFYTPSDDYGIPSRFNPGNTPYASNPAAPYSSNVNPDSVESGNTAFYTRINTTYRPQVQVAGSDAKTKLSADQFLATIPTNLAPQGDKLRYAPALYTAFRDAALAGKLASAAPADGVPGQKLVPFVYFTNEKDAAGLTWDQAPKF